MSRKKICLGILAFVLVFGMMVNGCSNGSSDPVKVDMGLPNIAAVASFEGTFVADKQEQEELIQDALVAMAEIQGVGSIGDAIVPGLPNFARLASRSISRSVQSQPLDQVIDFTSDDEKIKAYGFISGYQKVSLKNDDAPFESAGDSAEMSIKTKMAIDFDNVSTTAYDNSIYKFDGKYTYDNNIYLLGKLVSLNPESASVKLNVSASNGYALSVSKGGKGLKFVMKMTASVNVNKTLSLSMDDAEDEEFLDDILGDILEGIKLKITIDVYDNDNVRQQSIEYTDFFEASDFLDAIFGGLL
jgi:hypothetical protein